MAAAIYEYRVTITFDLAYSNNPEYRYINSYLDERGFYSLKSINDHMPSNIYTGTVFIEIEKAEVDPTLAELKTGSDRAARNTYDAIKKNAENAGLVITLFVQASPEVVTTSKKSRG